MRVVELPRSKSVVAREAMIAALSGGMMPDGGGSEDGDVVARALSCTDERVDVASSGTAARFAIAFYASRSGVRVIDGSEQLRRRPVSAVVDAMRTLGAEIVYMEREGRLPVRIVGCGQIASEVQVDASESSQSVSALMLIGAARGMRIVLNGDVVSPTYIELTRRVMERCGVKVTLQGSEILVDRGLYRLRGDVDGDWSSAVFWFGRVAVGEEDEVLLAGLRMGSVQPDERVVRLFEHLGVESGQTPHGVRINRVAEVCDLFEEDCKGCPDLVPVLVASLCRLGVRFRLCGLGALQRKESRRGTVMVREMRKLGFVLDFDGERLSWSGESCEPSGDADVEGDHRIAMALIVAGAKVGDVDCIEKSYRGLTRILKQ